MSATVRVRSSGQHRVRASSCHGTPYGVRMGTANGIPCDPLGVLVDALLTLLLGALVLARRLSTAASPRASTEPCCDAHFVG